MWSRRAFLRASTAVGAGALSVHAKTATGMAAAAAAQQSAEEVAVIEPFWREVRQAFALDPALINLNNGNSSPSPQPVHQAFMRSFDDTNRLPCITER